MIKVETLDELFGAREVLELRIIQLHPTTAEETSEVSQLMLRRDRITGAVNAIIAATFAAVPSTEALHALQQLKDKAAALNGLANTFDHINEALGLVDDVLGVVARLVQLATA